MVQKDEKIHETLYKQPVLKMTADLTLLKKKTQAGS